MKLYISDVEAAEYFDTIEAAKAEKNYKEAKELEKELRKVNEIARLNRKKSKAQKKEDELHDKFKSKRGARIAKAKAKTTKVIEVKGPTPPKVRQEQGKSKSTGEVKPDLINGIQYSRSERRKMRKLNEHPAKELKNYKIRTIAECIIDQWNLEEGAIVYKGKNLTRKKAHKIGKTNLFRINKKLNTYRTVDISKMLDGHKPKLERFPRALTPNGIVQLKAKIAAQDCFTTRSKKEPKTQGTSSLQLVCITNGKEFKRLPKKDALPLVYSKDWRYTDKTQYKIWLKLEKERLPEAKTPTKEELKDWEEGKTRNPDRAVRRKFNAKELKAPTFSERAKIQLSWYNKLVEGDCPKRAKKHLQKTKDKNGNDIYIVTKVWNEYKPKHTWKSARSRGKSKADNSSYVAPDIAYKIEEYGLEWPKSKQKYDKARRRQNKIEGMETRLRNTNAKSLRKAYRKSKVTA